MRGFFLGTLGLVAFGVLVRNRRATEAVGEGRSWFISGLRRALSADVAGVPQRKGAVT